VSDDLTPRGSALRWLTDHRGITEQPAGSNSDTRADGIRSWQIKCADGALWLVGKAWCGVAVFMALRAGGVKGISWRQASVTLIEDDARAQRAPFGRGWISNPAATGDHWGQVFRGDAVVMFGRGVHVETIRDTSWVYRKLGVIRTVGGNTSSGDDGSQSNGGGLFERYRRVADIHGIALVDYPDE
jgi:hypothetical protein